MPRIVFREHQYVHADGRRTHAGSHIHVHGADGEHFIQLAACDRRGLAVDHAVLWTVAQLDGRFGYHNMTSAGPGRVSFTVDGRATTLDYVSPPIPDVLRAGLAAFGLDHELEVGEPLLVGHGQPPEPVHVVLRDWWKPESNGRWDGDSGVVLSVRLLGDPVVEEREVGEASTAAVCQMVLEALGESDAVRLREQDWRTEPEDLGDNVASGTTLFATTADGAEHRFEIKRMPTASVLAHVLRLIGIVARIDHIGFNGHPEFGNAGTGVNLHLSAEMAPRHYPDATPVAPAPAPLEVAP